MPHAVVRLYTDSGPLIGMLREREDEVRDIMTSVPGFISYGIMDTGKGAISVTTCESKEGTDESSARAAEWIRTNLPDTRIDPPQILEGQQVVRFSPEGAPASARGGAHLVVRIFSDPPPHGLKDRMDEVREFMTDVPNFRTYAVVETAQGIGVSIIAGKDKSVTDEVSRRMAEFVGSQWPDFRRANPPQVFEAEGVFRFEAAATPA